MQDPIAAEKGSLDQEKRKLQSTQACLIINEEALEVAFTEQEPKKHTSVVLSSLLSPQKSRIC